MKKVIALLLALTLLSPAIVSAHPGDWGPGPRPQWDGHCWPAAFSAGSLYRRADRWPHLLHA